MTPENDNGQPQEWVHEVLEPDQLSAAQVPFPRKQLSRGIVILLWGMRVYVLLMLLLIAYEVWHVFATKGQ